jgi:DNA-binding MarR family transcriptional regulator
MDKVAVNRATRQIEKRSWVRRVALGGDRRSHGLYLTPKGLSLSRPVLPDVNARYREIVGCLSTEGRASHDQSLVKLIVIPRDWWT